MAEAQDAAKHPTIPRTVPQSMKNSDFNNASTKKH